MTVHDVARILVVKPLSIFAYAVAGSVVIQKIPVIIVQ
jgi:hypothetical protein